MDPIQARLFEPAIAAHAGAALIALLLGALVLAMRKGTAAHRLAGRGWALAMAATAASSFLIEASLLPLSTPIGRFGPIHALSLFTLWSLVAAIRAIRSGNVRAHRANMLGAFAGLAIAGAFTMVPGRTLHAWTMAMLG